MIDCFAMYRVVPDHPYPSGTVVGSYAVVAHIASGGFAHIYLATTPTFTPILLKCLRPARHRDALATESFLREVQVLSQLNHPFVPKLLDHGQDEQGHYYFVTPYFVACSLEQMMTQVFSSKATFDPRLVHHMLHSICEALRYVHHQQVFLHSDTNLFHGDLCPDNILIDLNGDAHLIDFGSANQESRFRNLKRRFANRAYIAPDAHEVPADQSADLYALSLICLELLSGQRVQEPSERDVALTHISHRAYGPFLAKALAPEISQRWPDIHTWWLHFSESLSLPSITTAPDATSPSLLPTMTQTYLQDQQRHLQAAHHTFRHSARAKQFIDTLSVAATPPGSATLARRRAPRIEVRGKGVLLKLFNENDPQGSFVDVIQLSPTGLLLDWTVAYNRRRGDTYTAELYLTEQAPPLHLKIEVLYAVGLEQRTYVGCSLTPLSDTASDRILSFLGPTPLSKSRDTPRLNRVDLTILQARTFFEEQGQNLRSRGLVLQVQESFSVGDAFVLRLHFVEHFEVLTLQARVFMCFPPKDALPVYGLELHARAVELARLMALAQAVAQGPQAGPHELA